MRIGPNEVRSEIAWQPLAGLAATEIAPLLFSTVIGPPAPFTVTPPKELLAYTSPPIPVSVMGLLPAVTLAPPLMSRRSTPPKLVSTTADPPALSPVTDELPARTVTSLPIPEKRTLPK